MRSALALALLLGLAAATPLRARADAVAADPPVFDPRGADLLPLDEFERQDFQRVHGRLVNDLRGLVERTERLRGDLEKARGPDRRTDDAPKAADRKRLEEEIARLEGRAAPLARQLTDVLLAEGLPGWLIPVMNGAPRGPWRVERHAMGLVLFLDLDPEARSLLERVVPRVQAALLALAAQKERMTLAVRQSEAGAEDARGLLQTFDRQGREVEQRFWHLVDFVVDEDQRARLHAWQPTALQQKAGPIEHLYALPDLSATQGQRIKALLTETEAEASADQAAVKRLGEELKAKDLPKEHAAALKADLGAAQARLAVLQRGAARSVRAVLTPAQVLAFEAIPPRLSVGERARDGRRLLEGMAFTAEQQTRLEALAREAAAARRALEGRVREIQKEGADYGPDSPQMMGMQMEMTAVRAQGQELQRQALGRAFLEVLDEEQIVSWLVGLGGERR